VVAADWEQTIAGTGEHLAPVGDEPPFHCGGLASPFFERVFVSDKLLQ